MRRENFVAARKQGKTLATRDASALRGGMILSYHATFHNTVTAAEIEKERRANKKALHEIFSNPRRAWRFLRKAGVELPRGKTTRRPPRRIPKTTTAR